MYRWVWRSNLTESCVANVNMKKFFKFILNRQFIAACQKADVEKVMRKLEQGFDPNQWVKTQKWFWYVDFIGDYPIERFTSKAALIDVCESEAVQKLLLAYGAKTTSELSKVEEGIRSKERQRQLEAEAEREKARQARVEAFLAFRK